MPTLRRALFALFVCLLPSLVFAQADMGVTASDSPDPVAPDGNITYTVNVTNNGPNPTTNANFNVILNGTLLFQSITTPIGWTCPSLAVGHGGSFTCTAAALPVGTSQFTVVLNAGKAQFGINDATINQLFGVNSSTPDPNNGNNNVTVSTAYVTPDADMSIAVTDSPDPVAPDGNITYTVNVTNGGPDITQNARLNVPLNNTLLFQSMVVPAGWSCPSLAVGHGASFTCTAATLGLGTSQFTIVLKAGKAQFGINDGTINQFFGANSDLSDPNNGNNNQTVSTAYVAPDADISVTVTDSPDPVAPDGNITYTVNVTNSGPDTATNVNLNVPLNNTLLFQSIVVPAGWSCPSLPVGHGASFTCSAATFGLTTSQFTIVLKAGKAQFGINDGTINQFFGANSVDLADPNNANNGVTVSTAYVAPDADMSVTAIDSPDPVFPDGNITYTVNVTNGGPDITQNAHLNVPMNNTLLFQSMVVPAGWSCPSLAVGHGASFTCTAATLGLGTSQFTIVLKAGQAQFGINDQTINQSFTVGSDLADPNNGNSVVTVSTAYVTPDADMSVTATDSPDPITPGQNLTYTIAVTNGGPDAAPNAHLVAPLHGNLTFQSLSAPAGWSCTTPAVGANGTVDCTNASFAASTANFTLVTQLNPALLSGPGGTIQQNFVASSGAQDPNNANGTVQVTTTYTTPTANLAATNTDTPDPVSPGGTITYTQTITNNGPDAATNAKMTQTLPAGVTFQSLSAPAGFSCTTPAIGGGGTITCTIASLANSGTGSFTLVVNVTATSGTITETVVASSDNFDNVSGNNTATTTTTINSADLSISKTTGSASATPGSTITYTITLTNAGPSAATSVVMTDALPASLLFQSITTPAGFSCTTPAVGATGTITCNAATLANGATATFTLTTTVAGNANGSITNSASASSATFDPNSGNSSGGASPVAVASSSADLAITKSAAAPPEGRAAGSLLDYSIAVRNFGPDAAMSVVVTDVLPPSLRFVAIAAQGGFTCTTPAVGASGTITCNAQTLANNTNTFISITVRIAPDATGSVTNTATVSSANDPAPDNGSSSATVPVMSPATDLSVTKTTPSTTVAPGGIVTYTITVTNAGPTNATNVVMTDPLLAGLEFVSATPSQGSCSGTTTVTCNLGNLLIGASATVVLQTRVTAASGGTVTNVAVVNATQADPDLNNNAGAAPAVPVAAATEAIPTLSTWALIALAIAVSGVALTRMR